MSVTTDSWTPTAAHFRATAVAIVLVTAALVWRRPDLLVIATPFALVVAWSTITRPTRLPELVDGFEHATIREGDAT
ncbi:MAG TPA: hypothetical protein VK860_09615, partial [Ilumatobacteraceae bacterium]|nr:hypothetical protein [Ilumatobacteraceae bacterium]